MFGKKMIASAFLAKQMQAFLDERNAEGLLDICNASAMRRGAVPMRFWARGYSST